MFGFVLPDKSELKFKEYDTYKGLYCGLCKETGKNFGPVARMSLSYDFVFFLMLIMALKGEKPSVEAGRCPVNPLKKTPVAQTNDIAKYTSAIEVLLTYHKICDNIADEKHFKKFFAQILRLLFLPAYKKAKKYHPDEDGRIISSIKELKALEQAKSDNLDMCAETFSLMLADLARPMLEGDSLRIATEILREIGRFVYILDSYADILEDNKKGNYNPLFFRFALSNEETIYAFVIRMRDEVGFTLDQSLFSASRAFELMEKNPLTPIIANIIFLGLPSVQKKKLFG